MADQDLIAKAEKYVKSLLSENLTDDHRYHNLDHTLSVRTSALAIAEISGLDEAEKELLQLAALFHDTGFIQTYTGHEDVSKKIAADFLKKQDYPESKIKEVLRLIDATRVAHIPQNFLEQIIKDADMNNLGQEQYTTTTRNLLHEWKVFLNKEYEEEEDWLNENIRFLKNHAYYTHAARQMYAAKKMKNRKSMKKRRNKLREKRTGTSKKKQEFIRDNKGAQMAFKTALRNHIDLTAIADSKANIMLSINSLIITLTLPLLASNLSENPFLLLPSIILLATCVISIIYATLATRPVKTSGLTNLEKLKTGQTNLFFFGNFYKMSLTDYKSGIKEVINEDEVLDEQVITDLYFLGKALGTKFNRLRVCYSIFMIGITTTVIAFIITFFISNPVGIF